MALGSQFFLLLWKNWTLQKRKICITLFEVLLPLFFGLILVLIRFLVKTKDYPDNTIWQSFDITKNDSNYKNQILFAPNETLIENIMIDVKNSINEKYLFPNKTIQGFKTQQELLEYHNLYSEEVWGAVVFDASESYETSLPANIVYDLRVTRANPMDRWTTDFTYNFIQTTSPRNLKADGGVPNYKKTGFLWLQYEVDKAIITQKSGKNNFLMILRSR
ncbi:ABCA3 [Mytilus edulis]|uniref:ABCA3 n=1 Tax=Mytilus edulis TaxID=6550 RepID=A0A8S3UE88_MYTED|nr:ABCA3 [Mytilus edulis]